MFVPAVFGPYKKDTSSLPSPAQMHLEVTGKLKRDERQREYECEAAREFEKMEKVHHRQ